MLEYFCASFMSVCPHEVWCRWGLRCSGSVQAHHFQGESYPLRKGRFKKYFPGLNVNLFCSFPARLPPEDCQVNVPLGVPVWNSEGRNLTPTDNTACI